MYTCIVWKYVCTKYMRKWLDVKARIVPILRIGKASSLSIIYDISSTMKMMRNGIFLYRSKYYDITNNNGICIKD